MRKPGFYGLLAGLVFLLVAMACAPAAAPAPAPAPAPPAKPPAPVSPEEAAWAKVVEAAKKEGSVVMYASTWAGDEARVIAEAFEKAHGIKFENVTGRGASLHQRIQVEQRIGQPVGDVTQGGPISPLTSRDAGATQSLANLVPNIKDLTQFIGNNPFYDEQRHVISYGIPPATMPWVNTNLVKPGEEPKSYTELVDPKWKGKLLMDDPTIAGPASLGFGVLLRNKVIDLDMLKKLGAQEPKLMRGYREEFVALARGEGHILVNVAATFGIPVREEGGPIKPIGLKEGVPAFPRVAAAVKKPAHPNATKVFLNWMFSPEGQEAIARAEFATPTRKGVKAYQYPAIQEVLGTYPLLISIEADSNLSLELIKDGTFAKIFKK